ncbi:hypothetical protein BGX27_000204 [Mortierella sp. AM989]|nr:hypothetical protein BGX27_000204 [Mortierella sp. AM989]
MTIAILFIGNTGAGKSTLLSLLGANFESGVGFRTGVTKEISEARVKVNGKEVVLMDVPGLFAPKSKETVENAKILTTALSKEYDYMLYFVLKASNRGVTDEEMVMMSKVNECIRQVGPKSKAKITFRVIVNQIPDDDTYTMYNKYVAQDNCKSLFNEIELDDFPFDITVSGVLMIRFIQAQEKAKKDLEIKKVLEQDIRSHKSFPVFVVKNIAVTKEDVSNFIKALSGLATVGAGLAFLILSVAAQKI